VLCERKGGRCYVRMGVGSDCGAEGRMEPAEVFFGWGSWFFTQDKVTCT
jgi:hypothetical protein